MRGAWARREFCAARASWLLVGVGLASLAGCAGPAVTPPPRILPAQILEAYDLQRSMDVEQARQAQRDVRQLRSEVSDGLLRERIACYRQFLVNRCLREVMERQRIIDVRIDAVEVAANQVLREQTARETSLRLAEDAARRAQQAAGAPERESLNREAYEARQTAAAQAQARREQEAPELERRAEKLKADAARRERAVQEKREAAEARANRAQARTGKPQSAP